MDLFKKHWIILGAYCSGARKGGARKGNVLGTSRIDICVNHAFAISVTLSKPLR